MAIKNKEMEEKGAIEQVKIKKYAIKKLQAHCQQLFGVSLSTFVGATYGMTEEYTIEEMKTHIETWKKKGVK